MSSLCVDPARVGVAGFSAGGGITALVACDLAGRVASVAIISNACTEPGEVPPPVLASQPIANVLWSFVALLIPG